jgi:GABA(A) receptor-associated protein
MSFKQKYSLNDRFNEAKNVMNKYPDRVPVICEKDYKARNDCPDIDKNKYLVPIDLTIGQFLYVIRKRMKVSPEKALFLFVNGTIPATSSSIYSVYYMHKDLDNFLYVTYSFENVFG